MKSVDYDPKTFRIAKSIVALALQGDMPVDKVKKDVMQDCGRVLERLGWTPPAQEKK